MLDVLTQSSQVDAIENGGRPDSCALGSQFVAAAVLDQALSDGDSSLQSARLLEKGMPFLVSSGLQDNALGPYSSTPYLDHRGNGRSNSGPKEAWTLANGRQRARLFEALGIERPVVL